MTNKAPEQTRAVHDVLAERVRQVEIEGFDAAHDAKHHAGELAAAATCYAHNATCQLYVFADDPLTAQDLQASDVWWPWGEQWWKPKTPRRDLVRAAALIIAEIERLDTQDSKA